MTVAFAGTQIHAEHRGPSCFSSKAGSRPGGTFTSFHHELYAYHRPWSYSGDALEEDQWRAARQVGTVKGAAARKGQEPAGVTFSHRDLSRRTGYPYVNFVTD